MKTLEQALNYISYEMKNGISPSDISYNETSLLIRGHLPEVIEIPCEFPRLAFAKALNVFPEEQEFYSQGTNLIHKNVIAYDNVFIGSYCTLGARGFGYEYDPETDSYFQVSHHGGVVLDKDVHIKNSVCIDRGVIGNTIIMEGTKIDNLVHIAHNVIIGKNCLVVAGAVIGGSVEIGPHSFVGMNASIKQKLKIGKNCTIGAGAVVINDVPDFTTVVGNPAKPLVK